jgi:hypothetical protein
VDRQRVRASRKRGRDRFARTRSFDETGRFNDSVLIGIQRQDDQDTGSEGWLPVDDAEYLRDGGAGKGPSERSPRGLLRTVVGGRSAILVPAWADDGRAVVTNGAAARVAHGDAALTVAGRRRRRAGVTGFVRLGRWSALPGVAALVRPRRSNTSCLHRDTRYGPERGRSDEDGGCEATQPDRTRDTACHFLLLICDRGARAAG